MADNIKPIYFGTIAKAAEDSPIFFNKKVSISFDAFDYDSTADYKVMVQIEPLVSGANVIHQIPNHSNKFDLILSWHPYILTQCENSELFPFGDCWIYNKKDRVLHKKTKTLSIIASGTKNCEGHILRHSIARDKSIDIDVFGKGYNFIENKITGFKDYMFSIVIENDNTDNWFTEKIIDCLVTGTVPIYWGCSNIGEYFNTKGFIQVSNLEEVKSVLPTLNKDKYNSMLPFIKQNYDLALEYADLWNRLKNKIKEKL